MVWRTSIHSFNVHFFIGAIILPPPKKKLRYTFMWNIEDNDSIYLCKSSLAIPFRFQRITRRQGGGSAGVYEHTLRKPTTKPTKLAKESGMVSGPLFPLESNPILFQFSFEGRPRNSQYLANLAFIFIGFLDYLSHIAFFDFIQC